MLPILRSLYGRLRSTLPTGLRGQLTRGLYAARLKPSWNRAAGPFAEVGTLVFSADFEMSWAFRYSRKRKNFVEMGAIERHNVPVLLKLFEHHRVPVTWATVGHLFLSSCYRNEEGLVHADMPRPAHFENRNWRFDAGDWYQHDPASDFERNPEWYAPDLIEQILTSEVRHEIGCHTFSHIDFTDSNCPPALAAAELRKCIELAAPRGITLRSMVFPGGTAGNYAALREAGFTNYRKPMVHDVDVPSLDAHGLVAIPSTHGLDRDLFGWSAATHLKLLRRYMDVAERSRQVCHFWFHPSMDPWYLERVMPYFLEEAAHRLCTGRLQVRTMAQIADAALPRAR